MKFPENPLIKFAQRLPEVLSISKIPTSTSSTLFFETKYGLRLQVSDDTPIRIESIRYRGKRLHEEFARDYEKLPTSNGKPAVMSLAAVPAQT